MPVLPILSLDLKEELIPDDGHTMEFNPRTGECTLSITEATPEDEKVYSVQAVNTFGRAECRANLVLSKFFLHFTFYNYDIFGLGFVAGEKKHLNSYKDELF